MMDEVGNLWKRSPTVMAWAPMAPDVQVEQQVQFLESSILPENFSRVSIREERHGGYCTNV
jgi:hypothetical protein